MPNTEKDFYTLGYVSRTHGIRGHVVIKLDVDDPEKYSSLKHVFFTKPELKEYEVLTADIRKDTAVVLLKGYENLNYVEQFVGSTALLPISELPPLDTKSVYLHEAPGMEVVDASLGSLGTVKKVYDLPHQPLAAVDVKGKEVLIPLTRSFIVEVDRANNILKVNLPDGLIDIYSA